MGYPHIRIKVEAGSPYPTHLERPIMHPLNDRPAAVSGIFYPESAQELALMLRVWLDSAPLIDAPAPKMLVVPHAGYLYSGEIAAACYKSLERSRALIKRVVLLGPCHRVPVRGLSYPDVAAFNTPLGRVELDLEAIESIRDLPQVEASTQAHANEHSLEVQLPFLQVLLNDFKIVPLVVGGASPKGVMDVIDHLWGGDETLIILSSDLSHFHDKSEAARLDQKTIERILALDPTLDGMEACGAYPLNGALQAARHHRLIPKLLSRGDSGDITGDHGSVVGYAGFGFWQMQPDLTLHARAQ